jgi:hypothetical protein
MATDKIACSLSLMRRLPPNKVEQNLSGLLNLSPEDTDELLQRVDQPLEEAACAETVRSPHLVSCLRCGADCALSGRALDRGGSSCSATTTATETATGAARILALESAQRCCADGVR